MSVFNPDRFFKGRTIFSGENFGPGDQNFQDQNSRDRPGPWGHGDEAEEVGTVELY